MDKRLIPLAVTAALCLASCSNDEVMERNPNPRGNAITFSAKVGRSTRATETTPGNLGNFYVFAKSVHPDNTLYDAFLIGSDGNTPEMAERQKGSGSWTDEWTLKRDVYLPNGILNVVFWAFTDQQTPATGEMGSDILSSGNVSFDNNTGPKIENYESAKADLTDTEKTTWADGSVQRDLVSAFADAKKDDGSGLKNQITLDFKHMLSEISIRGAQKNLSSNDHRRVFVKGVWIVNAQRKATLSAGYDKVNTKDNPNWEFSSSSNTFTQFGTYFSSPVELWKKKGESDKDWADLTSTPLMLIPQELTKWTPSPSDEFTACKGAYIMILCRVELEHDGDTHNGGNPNDQNICVKDGKHYHQQFPATNIYDSEQYGFACLPIGTKFEKGKRYRFNLNICGKGAGAGIYPPGYTGGDGNPIPEIMALIPDSEKDKIKIITIPTDDTDPKKPGDEVLDEAIKFTVDVEGWVDADGQWIDGTQDFD